MKHTTILPIYVQRLFYIEEGRVKRRGEYVYGRKTNKEKPTKAIYWRGRVYYVPTADVRHVLTHGRWPPTERPIVSRAWQRGVVDRRPRVKREATRRPYDPWRDEERRLKKEGWL